jgi:hypothetical protein
MSAHGTLGSSDPQAHRKSTPVRPTRISGPLQSLRVDRAPRGPRHTVTLWQPPGNRKKTQPVCAGVPAPPEVPMVGRVGRFGVRALLAASALILVAVPFGLLLFLVQDK